MTYSCSKRRKGQGLVEYALILTLVAVIVIAVLMALGPKIGGIFSSVNNSLSGIASSSSQPTVAPTVAPTAVTFDPVAACAGHNFAQECWTDGSTGAYCSGSPLSCHGMGSGGWLTP